MISGFSVPVFHPVGAAQRDRGFFFVANEMKSIRGNRVTVVFIHIVETIIRQLHNVSIIYVNL